LLEDFDYFFLGSPALLRRAARLSPLPIRGWPFTSRANSASSPAPTGLPANSVLDLLIAARSTGRAIISRPEVVDAVPLPGVSLRMLALLTHHVPSTYKSGVSRRRNRAQTCALNSISDIGEHDTNHRIRRLAE